MTILVKDRAYGAVLDQIEREPRQHAGWQSIRYCGRRYQLFGGIRGPFVIYLNLPLAAPSGR